MASSRGVTALVLAGAISVPCAPALAATAQQDPGGPVTALASPAPPVEVAAGVKVPDFATRAWVLADLDTGAILAQLNPHLRLRPASTQKLLTALTVAPRLSPDQLYRADKADEVADGNRVVLYDGLTYKVSDLLHAALLPSANDAAMALARANGGAARTVAQMNEEAARLGATDTTAVNPSGLDADGQFTSAHDLATIGREAFLNPEIAAYLKLAVVDFPGKEKADGSRVIYPIYNHNTMLRSGFKGALGGKSGYTTLARRTMVAAAERDGRRLVLALLDIGGNTYRTAEHLLNWGFAHSGELSAIGSLPQPSAPAPTFERVATPLPDPSATAHGDIGKAQFQPAVAQSKSAPPAAAPEAASGRSAGGSSWLLTLLTLLVGAVAVARARVYWLAHRAGSRRGGTSSPASRTRAGATSRMPRTTRTSARGAGSAGPAGAREVLDPGGSLVGTGPEQRR